MFSRIQWALVGSAMLAACGGAEPPLAEVPGRFSDIARPASCAGAALSTNTMDIDLSLVHLRGAIRHNMQALTPSSGEPRGTLVLIDAAQSSVQRIDLASTSTGAFDVMIPKGTYEVRYLPDRCALSSVTPCTPALIERALSVQSDTNRDINLVSVAVQATVKLDGAPITSGDGSITFENAAGTSPPVSINNLSAVLISPGRYRVRYVPSNNVCTGAPGAWPCSGGIIAEDVVIDRAQPLALDVRTTLVSAPVTINEAPAMFGTAPAQIELRDPTGFTQRTTVSTQAATIGPIRLVRGRYDLRWVPTRGQPCPPDANTPCNGGSLSALVLEAPTLTQPIALQAVTVRGAISVDSQRSANGAVSFIDDEKRRFLSLSVDSSYTIRLFRGARGALVMNTQEQICGLADNGTCGEKIFVESTLFNDNRTIDAAMTSRTVQIVINVDGQSVLTAGTGGLSSFILQSTLPDPSRPQLTPGSNGNIRVLDGTYTILSQRGAGGFNCPDTSPLPCGLHVLAPEQRIQGDGVVTVAVRTRALTGTLRINGVQPTFPTQLPLTPTIGLFSLGASAATARVIAGRPAEWSAAIIDAPVVGFVNSVAGCSLDDSAEIPALCGLSMFTGCGR